MRRRVPNGDVAQCREGGGGDKNLPRSVEHHAAQPGAGEAAALTPRKMRRRIASSQPRSTTTEVVTPFRTSLPRLLLPAPSIGASYSEESIEVAEIPILGSIIEI